MKKSSSSQKELQKAAEELLSLLGIKGEISIEEDKEDDALRVQIEAEEAGVLIGHHGETVGALQLILGQIFHQRTGMWRRVLVNVGDWRERREETLRKLAESVARQAKETGEPQSIFDLSAAERRIVHIALSSDPDIETESEGEGRQRHLVVKPKR